MRKARPGAHQPCATARIVPLSSRFGNGLARAKERAISELLAAIAQRTENGVAPRHYGEPDRPIDGIIPLEQLAPRPPGVEVVAHPGANRIRPGSLKWKWRAVVGQLATLKADQNLNCRGKPRFGRLNKQASPTAGLRRRGPKVGSQFRIAQDHAEHVLG